MKDKNNKPQTDINECSSRGACSVSPAIASLEYLLFTLLKDIAYYLLKLDELGASNYKIKKSVINSIALLTSANDFSEENIHSEILNEYYILNEVKNTYSNLCKNLDISAQIVNNEEYVTPKTTLAQTISAGEKLITSAYNSKSKNFEEILKILIKSLSINHVKLMDLDIFDENCYKEILKALIMLNPSNLTPEDIKTEISKLAIIDKNLQLKISETIINTFGGVSEVAVSHSSKKGKAILVSGNNFFDLYKVLKLTQDKNIDVYTHSNLLITHALEKFRDFEHLKGHYSGENDNCIYDFATFPGAILLTKDTNSNNEYLYRGRLFSTNYIIPKGVTKISNEDFYPLIDSALNSKGFAKGKTKKDTLIGFDMTELNNKFDAITKELKTKKIKTLYIIGIDAYSDTQKEYFKEFFENIRLDEYVISFSHNNSNLKNILKINLGNYTPFVTMILKTLFEKYPVNDKKLVFIFTTCDVMSISGICALKHLGAKNIYMAQCQPKIINPLVFATFEKLYNIKTTTSALKDLEDIRAK